MTKIKVWKVIAFYSEEEMELAVCTKEEYAYKAIQRLVEENDENENELYVVEDEIILDAIYGWNDGNLTE